MISNRFIFVQKSYVPYTQNYTSRWRGTEVPTKKKTSMNAVKKKVRELENLSWQCFIIIIIFFATLIFFRVLVKILI
jgi:hypothetical protein